MSDACNWETGDYGDMQQHIGALILAAQQEMSWHSSHVAEHDKRDRLSSRFPHNVTCPLCLSLQDGLVQAAALWKGLQRLLHKDRHQKGGKVSDTRMRHTRKPATQMQEENVTQLAGRWPVSSP